MGAEQRIFAHPGAMSNLHQVVDLRTARNARFADAGPIDTGISLDFNIVFNHGRAGLHDLVPMTFAILRKAETVASDYNSVL